MPWEMLRSPAGERGAGEWIPCAESCVLTAPVSPGQLLPWGDARGTTRDTGACCGAGRFVCILAGITLWTPDPPLHPAEVPQLEAHVTTRAQGCRHIPPLIHVPAPCTEPDGFDHSFQRAENSGRNSFLCFHSEQPD